MVEDVDFEKAFEDYEGSFDEPKTKELWASHGVWHLVGNGKVTNSRCGNFVGFEGCSRVELHNLIHVDGVEVKKDSVYVCLKHKSCFHYDCPTCYLSWANREAWRVSEKLRIVGVKRGLRVEHLTLSVPEKDFVSVETEFEKFVPRVYKALRNRFVLGGCIIFHGFRFADYLESVEKGVPFGWRWSPHFHVIGYILMTDFYRSIPKMFLKDGFVVKLMDARKTVYGTAFYQLNHAAYRGDVERFNVARWFGICRSEKVDIPDREKLCPCCRHELTGLHYFGLHKVELAKSLKDCKRGDRRFWSDLRAEDGCTQWVEKVGKGDLG